MIVRGLNGSDRGADRVPRSTRGGDLKRPVVRPVDRADTSALGGWRSADLGAVVARHRPEDLPRGLDQYAARVAQDMRISLGPSEMGHARSGYAVAPLNSAKKRPPNGTDPRFSLSVALMGRCAAILAGTRSTGTR